MSKPSVLCLIVLAGSYVSAAAADTASPWLNQDQQARRWLEHDDIEALRAHETRPQWRGLAESAAGDAAAATEQFAVAVDRAIADGDESALTRALYNQATAQLLAREFDQALAGFDQVLEREPAHADALANRAIAEALRALDESAQAGQQGQGEQSEQGTGDQSQGGESGEGQTGEPGEASDAQADPGEGSPESAGDQTASGEQGGESGAGQAPNQESPGAMTDQSQAEQEAEAARQALQQAAAEQPPTADSDTGVIGEASMPLSENEQATEQWLRRIPDDPAGLLRRKLLQSHERRYSDVGDGAQPW